jgi:hypothetical protein
MTRRELVATTTTFTVFWSSRACANGSRTVKSS